MWRLWLIALVLPLGATKPAAPPPAVPLPEPLVVVSAPSATETWPTPAATPTPAAERTRLVVECNPPDADQPGIVAVCVYQLAPAKA